MELSIAVLPVDMAAFKGIIESNYIYVDKIDLIVSFSQTKSFILFIFLRPRRLGKSTLVSTLYELFSNGTKNFKYLKIVKNNLWNDKT